jgi:hypothetical protein
VGQGLFYSGRIGKLNFLYDCGTQIQKSKTKRDRLKRIVDEYFSIMNDREKIHLLIISHFHEDHISGLPYIFENNLMVDTVILPYINPTERLLIAAINDRSDQFFFSFIADPVNWLINQGVQHIMLLGGSEEDDESRDSPREPNEVPENPFEDPLKTINQLRESFLEDPELEKSYKNKELTDDDFIERNKKKDRLSFKKGSSKVVLHSLWEMIFYVKKVDHLKLKEFKDCVMESLDVSSSKEALESLVAYEENRKNLAECYKNNISKDLNETSLCVCHGPVNGNKNGTGCNKIIIISDFFINVFFWPIFCPFTSKTINNYQLLAGDISMNMENTLCQLENHLNKQAKGVTLFLVPHHGSVNNFNSKVFERFPNIRVAVISAGMINSYGHPSPEVIRHIVDKGICPIWCDEDHKVTFRQFVYY